MIALASLLLAASAATAPPDARLLRFPDIHEDFVVFVYAGDLWRAPSSGGPAWRLTSHAGTELFPKISPDGAWIAFSAEYTGTRQVYVMPAWGGPPRQLTYYNDVGPMPPRGGWDNWILGWTAEGKILVRMNRTPWGERMGRYFLVDPKGGLETPLPLPEGGSASLSPDGTKLAYTPIDREFRTWKRTMGGRAQDVWIYDLKGARSERVTDWKGTDNFPMWAGATIYFTSDREHTLNLYAYDTGTKQTRKVTRFDDYDVLWPSLGPGAIVFMNGGWLWKTDLATGRTDRIPVTLGSDAAATVPAFRDVQGQLGGAEPSPSGARVVLEARGELFTVPAKDGAVRNLSQTQGVREHSPAWSPDGKWIAYLSDATGEYEIWVRAQDGSGTPRRLTTDGDVWRFAPAWSPDSKKLAWGDRKRRLRVIDVESAKVTEVDRGTQGDLETYVWSPDSKWLAYETGHPTRLPAIAVWSLEAKRSWVLGDGLTADFSPSFSPDGKVLWFLSNRNYDLTFSAFEFNYVYRNATEVLGATLAAAGPSPFPPRSDEEAAIPSTPAKREAEPPVVVRVDPEGFVARTVGVPGLEPGDYAALGASEGALWYLKGSGGADGERALWRYDLKERKEEKVTQPCTGYALSADGKKLLYRAKGALFLVDAKAGAKDGDGKLDLAALRVKVDPKLEWAQMFDDAWRITRDWFYDDRMHGVDWDAMKRRYGALVPFVAHRADLDFILGEMLGELEAGHTYVASGDEPRVPRVAGGMLGCELQADPSGRYRIAKIFGGENWDDAWRSPLTEPGLDVREGMFLLAIDGVDLATTDNPYRLLENKANALVSLRVGERADGVGSRLLTVRTIASEGNLRYLDWVRSRMALVDRLSGGKVGYLHLPDTAVSGNRMLQKLFYSQASKPALIVDDRYNGGGFIPDRMIEYFSRRTLAYWARQGIDSMRTPGFAHDGPKAMLVNGYSSSGGDALPYFFRLHGLGPLIGTRTWGGLIGLSGNPSLVDGGSVQVPTFRIYDRAGNWVVENEGVTPDIEVVDLPERRIAGGDPGVEKAVEVLLQALAKEPSGDPKRPTPPTYVP
jgi:tricorn protease